MGRRVTERQLNVTICLLATRGWLTRDQIRDTIEGYQGSSDEAFERMFERDKRDLRGIGIPIEVSDNQGIAGSERGYRIVRDEFELPPVDLTPDEAAVVALATQAWAEPQWRARTRGALAKLEAAGVQADPGSLDMLRRVLVPRELADGDSLQTWAEAVQTRRALAFVYAGVRRRLQPWILAHRRGAWYVAGLDLDKQAERVFRVSRVEGRATFASPPGSFEIPAHVGPEWFSRRFSSHAQGEAVVGLKPGAGSALRRQATPVDVAVPAGFEALSLAYGSIGQLAGALAELADDAIAISPPDLVTATIELLQASVERAEHGH